MNGATAIVLQGLTIIFFCDVTSVDNAIVTDIKWFINGKNYNNSNNNILIDTEGPALIFRNVQSNLNKTNIKCLAVYYDMYYYNSSEVVLLVQGELTRFFLSYHSVLHTLIPFFLRFKCLCNELIIL